MQSGNSHAAWGHAAYNGLYNGAAWEHAAYSLL